MYLKRLYKHNRVLFSFVLLFAVAQLLNNIRQDAAISPIYAYGMYSEVMKPGNYSIPEIRVDSQYLQTKDFSPQQWDKIELPLILFETQQQHNYNVFKNHIHPLLHTNDSSEYVNTITPSEFNSWYAQYLRSITGKDISKAQVTWHEYFFNGSVLEGGSNK